jgi:hypothetical protein
MGCSGDVVAIVDHPDHGRRAACEDHADGYPVLEEVEPRV